VADIDGDGLLEVVAGSGTYYNNLHGGIIGHYFTAWNHDGSQLWKVDMPDTVSASPVAADIQGDGRWEVFVSSDNGTVYAFDGPTGTVLWAVEGLTFAGDPVLVDYNGDGVQDVVVIDGWNVSILDGTSGARLTPLRNSLSHLSLSSPAVGDLDGDGVVDLVRASGTQIDAWSLPSAQIPGLTPEPGETPEVTPEPGETPEVTPEPGETPEVSINFETGSPGSFFTISGSNFPAGTTVTLRINTEVMTVEATTDDNGNIIFILDTSSADTGNYTVTISGETQLAQTTEASITFALSDDAPLREREAGVEGIEVVVPSGIGETDDVIPNPGGFDTFLPLIQR
jgi:hypothetical protein